MGISRRYSLGGSSGSVEVGVGDVEGLQDELDDKADTVHTHAGTDLTSDVAIANIPTGTSGTTVALGNHTHAIANVVNLQTTLNGKQDTLAAGVVMTGTASAVEDVAAAPTMEEFNGLLAALRVRGVIS